MIKMKTYGQKVLSLQPAIDKGELKKVLKSEDVFVLLNRGFQMDREVAGAIDEWTDKLFTAAEKGDKDGAKKAYKQYLAATGLNEEDLFLISGKVGDLFLISGKVGVLFLISGKVGDGAGGIGQLDGGIGSW